MNDKIRLTVWNEYRQDNRDFEGHEEDVVEVYPDGIHEAIAGHFGVREEFEVCTATLDEAEHGLTEGVLDDTDVLIWWGHLAHDEVEDEVVDRVYDSVLNGMGLIVLHSAHASKIFRKLCGTDTQGLKWREAGETERMWVIEPGHPIAEGIDEFLEIETAETYGERFDIPDPDELVFVSWFEGGEVFRSGCCFNRGKGRIFYFKPGHEEYPIFYNKEVLKVIENAVRWAAPSEGPEPTYGNVERWG
ncbi:PalA [candidate division MSBL1 archaeon SCGC-AAA259O05]|uniref:PalA n=1 Tax=candidate division MSBL1 archaeon SCGC-AAA259O05 TaxID=1698271 RepID=A0A133V489_9EURY|nr:PalA [candidate division MSBL1 archaeon SCGC-AAA259O05]